MLDKKDQLTLSTKFKDYKPLQGYVCDVDEHIIPDIVIEP